MEKYEFLKKLAQEKYAETEKVIENGNLLLNNQFVFTHPYDMEAYHIVVKMPKLNWLYTPNEDPEWTFMLNRQEYLLDLLIAFKLTTNFSYLEKAKSLMLDWIDNCQDQQSNGWRTIDTGIRILYWSLLLETLLKEGRISEKETIKIKESLMSQSRYLDEHYILKYDLSNWGVLISSGIIVTANLVENIVSETSYQLNESRVCRQIELQIQNSGLHWEQSPLYFMEVWRQLTVLWLSYRTAGRECPDIVVRAIEQMLGVAPHLVKPDGYLLQQGDTDRIKIDDMIQTVSLLLGKKIPKNNCSRLSIELLLLMFEPAYQKLAEKDLVVELSKLERETTEKQLIDYETGNFFYRNNWEKSASFLHVFSGPLSSGHGHASLGHFDYSFKGQDIFIDPGRYTYQEVPERISLKSAESHNVLVLNDNPFTIIKDSWGYSKSATALASQSYVDETITVTQIMYLDEQGTGTVKVIRTIIWLIEEELLIITDFCSGFGEHKVTQYLNLAPTVMFNNQGTTKAFSVGKDNLFLQSNYSEMALEKGLYSPKYNQKETIQRLKSQTEFSNTFFGYTVISPDKEVTVSQAKVRQSGTDKEVECQKCFGIVIKHRKGEHLFSFQQEDTYQGNKLYTVNDEPVYGKVTWVSHTHNQRNYQRLL